MIWLVVFGVYGFGLIASIGFTADVIDDTPWWTYVLWPITWPIGAVMAFGAGARVLADWFAHYRMKRKWG